MKEIGEEMVQVLSGLGPFAGKLKEISVGNGDGICRCGSSEEPSEHLIWEYVLFNDL